MTESAPQRTPAWRELAAILVLALACALFFWKAVTLQGVFFHYDHAIQNYPYRLFFATGLRQGRLPLWTGDIFCGFPLFAESQGNAAYPPFLILFGLLEPWVAYNYYTVLHFLLAGVFTYVLARVMSVGRAGAVLAGICYMLAGPVVCHAHHTNIVVGVCWLPLLLALTELAFRRRSPLPLFGLAAATGALILGAQPQYTLYCALVCAVYALWRLRLVQAMGGRLRTLVALPVALGFAAVLGAALAAVQLLPLLELVGHSTRAGAAMALPGVSPGVPGNLLTLMLPHYFGSPGLGSYWGDVDPGLYAELTLFMGAAPLALALFGALTERSRKALFFAGLGLFAFLFSLGLSAAFYNAFALLPIFRTARFPSRFAFVTALCVAMLAGMGLERLLRAARTWRIRRAAVISAALILVLATAALTVAGASHANLMPLGREQLRAALPLRPAELEVMWTHLHGTLPADVWRLVIAASGGALLMLAGARRLLPPAAGVACWCALVFGELAFAGREFSAVTSPAVYRDPPPLAQKLRSLPPGRIFRYRYYDPRDAGSRVGLYPFTRGWAVRPEAYALSLARLPHNSNMIWGIPSVSGFSPLQTRALKALLGRPRAESTLIEFQLSPVLDLLGARYILTPRRSIPVDYPLLDTVDDINIFLNDRALPRAFIVHRGEVASSDEAAVSLLRSVGFDYRGVLLLHDPRDKPLRLPPQRSDEEESAKIVAEGSDSVTVAAELKRPGYLVLADQYYPGWTARVDGQEAKLVRADFLLRAVRLDAATHRVEFSFRSVSFRIGAAVTVGAVFILIGGLLAFLVLRRKHLPGLAGRELKRPMDGPYGPKAARLLVLTWLVFLGLGPVLSPVHWQLLGLQVDPRRYVVADAVSVSYFQAADDEAVEGYVTVRDTCRWWPQDYLLRHQLVNLAQAAVRDLMESGRVDEAAAIAAETAALAPDEVREGAPALLRLAERAGKAPAPAGD